MTAPRILVTVSRRWTDRAAITDALRNAVDSLIRDGHAGPITLVHACRADPVADELWRGWHVLRPDWFAEPVLWRTVEHLDRADAAVAREYRKRDATYSDQPVFRENYEQLDAKQERWTWPMRALHRQ